MMEPAEQVDGHDQQHDDETRDGKSSAHFAAIIGISVIARKWPKIADPAISIRVIIEVFNAP